MVDEVPMFQKVGGSAYKEGLETTIRLDEYFSHPHKCFRTIHVAGTNGKGSCSHTLAAVLQTAGYKVGLYTSPHLVDFRERIKVNGEMIAKEYVTDFVSSNIGMFRDLNPSFFELTTSLAFNYFRDMGVDVAVIEVGMGGRLDCTNIIMPDLAVITNISFDHMQFLGNTLPRIAQEKAGIIKPGVPVVIGESDDETRPVFASKAAEVGAPLTFADDEPYVIKADRSKEGGYIYETTVFGTVRGELGGSYQVNNTNTILHAVSELQRHGYRLSPSDVKTGLGSVVELTGFYGRWQILMKSPTVICDVGHNIAGLHWVVEQLRTLDYDKLYFVIGMVSDKDVSGVMKILPKDADYIFTKASIPRALDEHALQKLALQEGLRGIAMGDVASSYRYALERAKANDVVFIGGSCFVVADLLSYIKGSSQS